MEHFRLIDFEHGLNYVTSNYEAIEEGKMIYFWDDKIMNEMGTLKELRTDMRNVGRSSVYSRTGFFPHIRALKGRVYIHFI